MDTKTKSATNQLNSFIKEYVDHKEEVSLPDIVQVTLDEFQGDTAFLAELGKETLRETIYERVQRIVATTRNFIYTNEQTAMSKEGVNNKAKRHSIFANWLEHSGKRHIRVMEATREDLLLAADERQKSGEYELRLASLWRKLAETLEGGQKVNTKYTAEEIEELYNNL